MPTTKRRFPITETDDVAAVLDAAARRWPGESRQRLIVRVLLDWFGGGRSPAERQESRAALIGTLPGSSALYDRDAEWPE